MEVVVPPGGPMLAVLDFWIGRWSVRTRDGEHAGVDVVERALGGHAVLEHWCGADGGEGESLFFLDRNAGTWRQVWATADHHKEKTLELAEPGRVRFAGTVHAGGRVLPDRTTLIALPDGRVGQLIEHSLDGGATWMPSFDAIYEPSAQRPTSNRASSAAHRGRASRTTSAPPPPREWRGLPPSRLDGAAPESN